MSALLWQIKGSLISYVRKMDDGVVSTSGGAEETPDGFLFPGDASRADDGAAEFRGSVSLLGHGGLLRIAFSNPHIVKDGDGYLLSIADPDGPQDRLDFARIHALEADEEGVLRGRQTVLTAEGAELFFGPYEEGTSLDEPAILPALSV